MQFELRKLKRAQLYIWIISTILWHLWLVYTRTKCRKVSHFYISDWDFQNFDHLDEFFNISSGYLNNKNCWTSNYILFCWKFVKYFFPFFQILKIRDSSSVVLSTLCHFLERNWLKIKNYIWESDSCGPLFCIKIARTWRLSDVISDQPILSMKMLFARKT